MFATTFHIKAHNIRESIGDLSKILNVGKYTARISLGLSSTIAVSINDLIIQKINDIE